MRRQSYAYGMQIVYVWFADQVDGALRAMRVLSEQMHLLDCTSESVTEGVHVEMTSTFLQVP